MRHIIIGFCGLILFFFVSCSYFLPKQDERNSQEEDAKVILNRAVELIERNEYDLSERLLLDSYEKYSLIDNAAGKAKALARLLMLYAVTGNSDGAQSTIKKINFLPFDDQQVSFISLNAKVEYFSLTHQFDSVLSLTEKTDNIRPIEQRTALLTSRINTLIQLNRNYSNEIERLKKLMPKIEEQKLADESSVTVSSAYYVLALTSLYAHDQKTAEKYIHKAIDIDRAHSNSRGLGDDLSLLAEIKIETGAFAEAYSNLRRASEIYSYLNAVPDAQLAAAQAANILYKRLGDLSGLEELKELYRTVEDKEIRDVIENYLKSN
jgi:tetratricopeptide (TPR) repeat protein